MPTALLTCVQPAVLTAVVATMHPARLLQCTKKTQSTPNTEVLFTLLHQPCLVSSRRISVKYVALDQYTPAALLHYDPSILTEMQSGKAAGSAGRYGALCRHAHPWHLQKLSVFGGNEDAVSAKHEQASQAQIHHHQQTACLQRTIHWLDQP